MSQTTVRPATLADCEAISAIYAQSLEARDSSMEIDTSAQKFEVFLNSQGPRECLLVLCREEEILGYGVVKAYSDRVGYRVAGETSIYLRRELSGGGLGSTIQRALIQKCRELEYHHVCAKVWAANEGSVRFHQKFGYELVGIQKEIGYLGGEWKDIALMQLVLPEVPPHRPDIV